MRQSKKRFRLRGKQPPPDSAATNVSVPWGGVCDDGRACSANASPNPDDISASRSITNVGDTDLVVTVTAGANDRALTMHTDEVDGTPSDDNPSVDTTQTTMRSYRQAEGSWSLVRRC